MHLEMYVFRFYALRDMFFPPVFLGRVFDRDLIEKMIEKSTPGTLVGLHRRVRIAHSHFVPKMHFLIENIMVLGSVLTSFS